MELKIDTTDNQKAIVQLENTKMVKSYESPRGQDVLRIIDEVIKQADKRRKDITKITVNPGPGSFTSTRVGVAVANALALALKIPVNERKVGEFVKPVYDKPPSITLSQKK